jgi:hypothetical protein
MRCPFVCPACRQDIGWEGKCFACLGAHGVIDRSLWRTTGPRYELVGDHYRASAEHAGDPVVRVPAEAKAALQLLEDALIVGGPTYLSRVGLVAEHQKHERPRREGPGLREPSDAGWIKPWPISCLTCKNLQYVYATKRPLAYRCEPCRTRENLPRVEF